MTKQVYWCYVFLTLRISLMKITFMNLTNFPCFYPSLLATKNPQNHFFLNFYFLFRILAIFRYKKRTLDKMSITKQYIHIS
jgi:hypothetical protein